MVRLSSPPIAGILLAGFAGAVMAARSGRDSPGDDAPEATRRRHHGGYDLVGRTVTIARPRQELFDHWLDFGNLAGFMENVVKVRSTGDCGRCVWTIRAPAGRTVDVETEIVREQPGELIAWRSVPGSQIATEGEVTFTDAPGERGTRVAVNISYKPPGGEIGRVLAKLFQREPEIQARHDLKRFKMLMETGEIATSARRKSETRAAKQNETMEKEPA